MNQSPLNALPPIQTLILEISCFSSSPICKLICRNFPFKDIQFLYICVYVRLWENQPALRKADKLNLEIGYTVQS